MKRFVLDPQLEPADALRAAAFAEAERAQRSLQRGQARDVHETRKSCKRLRALARLLRDAHEDLELPGEALNAWLRAAASAVAPLRNTDVALRTFAALHCPDDVAAEAWAHIGAQLQAEYDQAAEAASGYRDEATTALQRATELLAALHLPELRPRDLEQAAQRAVKRGRKTYRTAQADPRPALLHEWRTKVKRLAYQLELLGEGAPDFPQRELKALGEALGEHHDLHALEEGLQADPDRYGGEMLLWRVHERLQQRARPLEQRALTLGEKLFG